MPNVNQEKRIISEWVAIQKSLGIKIQDPEWRDGPNAGDIEAVAPPFAIEHTSVDSIKNQRLYEVHFRTVFNDIRLMTVSPPARIIITINLEDFVRTGKKKLKAALKQWITDVSPGLPEGHSRGSQIVDLPVEWRCWKYSNRPPGLYFGLGVDTEKNKNEFADLLSKKDQKLETYRRQGLTSVIIVESGDLQLMAHDIFFEMALKANKDKDFTIDQLWFVDTSLDHFEFWRIDLRTRSISGPYSIDCGGAV